MLPSRWFMSVVSRFAWTRKTVGRGRRRVTLRKWVSWPNHGRSTAVVRPEDRSPRPPAPPRRPNWTR